MNSTQLPLATNILDAIKNSGSTTVKETSQFAKTPSSKSLRTSTLSILNAIGNRFFSKTPEDSTKQADNCETKSNHSNKQKAETLGSDHAEEKFRAPLKERKPFPVRRRVDCDSDVRYKLEQDFRRFRSKYNNGVGNIVRSWMNLIYCVLILRMNVVKLVLQQIQQKNPDDCKLERQIRFESKIIYNMIRKAQTYSQERSLFLWNELEKLIVSRAVIRSALEEMQDKEIILKDWKGTEARLQQVKREVAKLRAEADEVMKMKEKVDVEAKEKMTELEAAEAAKDNELKQLLHQISEMKRKEVKLRVKILLNMKNYKELKTKKHNLMTIERDLIQLKSQQMMLTKEYTSKIQMLTNEIEEKERQISKEKDEKKRLKANLEGLGDQNLNDILKEVPSA